MNRLFAAAVATVLACALLGAQSFPPGYVDPLPLLAAASKEIGEANLRCITFSGTGYDGAVGQTFEYAVNIDWPRIDALANYTRTINWETGTSKETFDRKPGLNPASWKYGLGWRGGTPIQKQLRQTHIVNGAHAWHIDGEGGAAGGGVARGCGALSTRLVAQPAGLPQGGAFAGRQSQGDLAMGTDRDGPRRQRRRSRRRCTWSRSPCSASIASKRRSTRRTRFSASRRR